MKAILTLLAVGLLLAFALISFFHMCEERTNANCLIKPNNWLCN